MEDLLSQLTLDEKLHLLSGAFFSGGVPRLGIPPLVCADGPVGVRLASLDFAARTGGNDLEVQQEGMVQAELTPTAFPSTIGLAATFNPAAAFSFAAILGKEAKAAGIRVMFGPGLNLMRDPRCGRNYEYMGEDPFLTGTLGCAYIRGMQNEGVGACAKHYYANDMEDPRHHTSSNLDERTAWEMHLRPFAMACREAGVWSMMTGNNIVNGTHISENPDENRKVLRDRLQWDGVMLTDWRAAYTPEGAVAGGMDMTTGFCRFVFGDGTLKKLVDEGAVTLKQINTMAGHVLLLYKRTGALDTDGLLPEVIDTEPHREPVRRLTAESMVLLKNGSGLLPLDPGKTGKIILCGPGADVVGAGTGSGKVDAAGRETSILAGLRAAFPEAVVDVGAHHAAGADAVVYCAMAPTCGEGMDMERIVLDDVQVAEIQELAEINPNLAVVLQTGTAVDMAAWNNAPQAVLVAWFGGQELGNAVADIVSGAFNPSGKLPCTFAKSIDDYPCSRNGTWPAKLLLDEHPPLMGVKREELKILHAYDADYTEGVFIGYRWFQKEGIVPLYPFGYGLSYTSFEVTDAKLSDENGILTVRCAVTNTGKRAGAEAVQVYAGPVASVPDRPVRELKGVEKVFLGAGERQELEIFLPENALAMYDMATHKWKVPAGTYRIEVGTSCEDIAGAVEYTVPEDRYYPV